MSLHTTDRDVAAHERARIRREARRRVEPTERPLDRGSIALAQARADRAAPRPAPTPPAPARPPRSLASADRRETWHRVLSLPCPAHGVAENQPCYLLPVGICGARITRALGPLPGPAHRPFYNGAAVAR